MEQKKHKFNIVDIIAVVPVSYTHLLENGKALVKNHLYMMTIEGRGVKAGSGTVKVLVRGS